MKRKVVTTITVTVNGRPWNPVSSLRAAGPGGWCKLQAPRRVGWPTLCRFCKGWDGSSYEALSALYSPLERLSVVLSEIR
jgi:hypothetical protein